MFPAPASVVYADEMHLIKGTFCVMCRPYLGRRVCECLAFRIVTSDTEDVTSFRLSRNVRIGTRAHYCLFLVNCFVNLVLRSSTLDFMDSGWLNSFLTFLIQIW